MAGTDDDLLDARRLLDGVAHVTPLQSSTWASELVGHHTLLKCEHLQRTGSFKLRGAYVRIHRLPAERRAAGVVAASAGNHAQGVALAARLLGVGAVVFTPRDAPIPKIEATRSYGADVRLVDGGLDACLDAAVELADAEGRELIHPYDHPDVVAGQASLGLELLDQLPAPGTVVVPLGGGGLLAGVALALRHRSPGTRLVGVQASGAASYAPSLAAGHPVTTRGGSTIADGIAVPTPGRHTLPIVAELVDAVVDVDDRATAAAVVGLAERAKQVVEPSGAVGLAALAEGLVDDLRPPVVVVLSGGNIDPLVLRNLLTAGLTTEGRYLTLRTRISDRPGSLAALLDRVASLRANVVSIEHHRARQRLGLGEVEVVLELETRGHDHIEAVLEGLRGAGVGLDVA